ncbi:MULTISPECIES: glutamate ligase domain-containing protein [Wolbachia]|uniref:glutamate ligase domain-containing protein n=1 Tax=Wolbachia TaxID=953 RepID=UPI00024040FF|nr:MULTISPECIES: cyanophycin synthetase [Wolbachia]UYC23901.1 recombinase zinc beta ribbon domain-containing protein [Wolbachia endosymbiont of Aedes aegypti]QBB83967.1 murC [Wolbachia pipientis wAlbB]QDW08771.1 murC [Wolbachia pipientis]QDW09966.1 murC [Wolbachia pipientis]QZA83039.1 recombinase zinc beta ribbon domain-containing protein [Wolbachia pipientis]
MEKEKLQIEKMQQSGSKYLLQELIVCQYCKYTYYGMSHTKEGKSYYCCSGIRFDECNSKSICADILEEVIWEEVKMVREHITKEKCDLSEVDWETKFNIIRKLVQRIEIDDDNVHMVFRLKELALERQKEDIQPCTRIIKNVVLSNAIGMHKVSNALAAISVAVKLGIGDEEIKKGLLEFKGVARRFSLIADIKGVKLIEDYAHHPSEIQATLKAARLTTKGKVIGIIEPLRFARIRNFFDEFVQTFMMFDYIILTPVHPPEDKSIPGCGIDDIQKALINNGFNDVKIMNDALLISHFISNSTSSGDVVLFIGAGSNIAKLAREAAKLPLVK